MGILRGKEEIAYESIIKRTSSLLYNKIENEVVMLNLENNEYYGMEKVGSRIWDLLEDPISFKALIEALMEEYEVDKLQCTQDTKAFLQILQDKDLIKIN